jgi:hypothetical protein
MTNLKSDEFAFIVRIWKDSADSDGSVSGWHGSIDHVGSNQRLYFYQLESILQFVRERTGIGFKPVKSWWKKLRDRLSFHFLVMR